MKPIHSVLNHGGQKIGKPHL